MNTIEQSQQIVQAIQNGSSDQQETIRKRKRLQIQDSDEENGLPNHVEEPVEVKQNGFAHKDVLNGHEEIIKKIKSNEDDQSSVKSKDLEQDEVDIEENELLEESQSISEVDSQKEEKRRVKKQNEALDDEDFIYVEKLPKNLPHLRKMKERLEQKIKLYKLKYLQETFQNEEKKSKISDNAIPICADIRQFNFSKFRDEQLANAGRLFDVIMMDPPWQLSTSQPSRGVAIAYQSLSDELIGKMQIEKLQTDGMIFIWTINAKYRVTCKLIEQWGYKLVDEIIWIKKTVNGKIAKGHGFYLQHAKENCLIGVKGDTSRFQKNVKTDLLFSTRRGQSQKPEEIYQYIEQLIPNGHYLEIFGRRNNIRENWVTIGNEL